MTMKANNILFDLVASQPIEGHAYHGGGKYAKKLFLAIAEYLLINNNNWNLYALYDSSLNLDNAITRIIDKNQITLVDIKGKDLREIVKEFSISRFYSALPFNLNRYDYFDLIETNLCENIITIHGLRTLEIPVPLDAVKYIESNIEKVRFLAKQLLERRLFSRDIKRYEKLVTKVRVLAVSEHTKYSIMAFFPSVSEIPVFYSPDVTEFDDGPDGESEQLADSNYFLLVNGNRWLKNNLECAKALDELFSERPNITQNVIITGVSDPKIYLSIIKNKSRFKFYKYISDNLLASLYKNAFAFLYLSLNEGFGYPPLEAMKWGTPVLTSPHTSIPEICGDSVLYSNPYSKSEIKSRILQLLDEKKYAELRQLGNQRFDFIRHKQSVDLDAAIKYLLS